MSLKEFNVNLFIFNCVTSNFGFPKNISFARRTAVYGGASLVSDFKLIRENDDLLSSTRR